MLEVIANVIYGMVLLDILSASTEDLWIFGGLMRIYYLFDCGFSVY